ncbi:MAG: hypothetical protein ACR5LG_16235 [Sodalis sp. (in: enterobacteria)]|uniref:hypothetical protein n=1 Tax=Sodalis sp. (in: enterobacteria) TaxID=1898979 RepID=UPI003F373535
MYKGLRDKNWLVLVEEAELLPYKALEVLRRIHDRSGVAIVLAGMALDLASRRKESEAEDFSAILGSLLSNGEVSDKPLVRGVARTSAIGNQGMSVTLIDRYAEMLIH